MESVKKANDCVESNEKSNIDPIINELTSLVKDCVSGIVSYCNAGIAQNMAGILTAFLAIASSNEPTQAIVFIGVSIFNLGEGFSKYKEYKKLKRFLEKYGFDEKFVRPKSLSWCQRHLSKIAAKQTGQLKELEDFYEREGHYWYHIFPKLNRMKDL